MNLDLYNLSLITILISISLLLLSYQTIRLLSKESLNKANKFFFISRIAGILIILAFFLHPIIRVYSQEKQSNIISVYIDNSKSMLNNISINDLEQILSNIEKWGLENDYLINWYSVGDNVVELDDINIDLSQEVTNVCIFKSLVLNSSNCFIDS